MPLAEEIRAAGFAKAIFKPLGLKELGESLMEGVHPVSHMPADDVIEILGSGPLIVTPIIVSCILRFSLLA